MIPECHHIKTSGEKCGALAMRGQPFCYFHSPRPKRAAQPRRSPRTPLAKELSNLKDRGTIQHAVTQLEIALAERRIEPKHANLILHALQTAFANAKAAGQTVFQ